MNPEIPQLIMFKGRSLLKNSVGVSVEQHVQIHAVRMSEVYINICTTQCILLLVLLLPLLLVLLLPLLLLTTLHSPHSIFYFLLQKPPYIT
jgi:hypothetical protein